MPLALDFEDITKDYRSFLGRSQLRALDGFSLQVQAGEIFGFLGQNGAGKTTAIHLAMGFMRPSGGRGRMLGHPFGYAPIRRRVGFLAENVALYHRNAESLVRFYGALNGVPGPELGKKARAALEIVGLQDQIARNVSKYSRGMLQRVGLAQALVNDPELLILDEPTSALDPVARVAVRELLLKLRNAGTTIFLSSHLLSEVELICDRVGVLHRGRLVRLGRMEELLEAGGRTEIVAKGVAPDVLSPDGGARGGAATAKNDEIVLTVSTAGQRESLERIWRAGGEVVSVNPVRRSLEEIFLEATAAVDKSKRANVQ
jgi:ABC-2 type transport system ATP-binding protein